MTDFYAQPPQGMGYPSPPAPPATGQYPPLKEERDWALYAYLGTLLLGWIGLLVVYLVKGSESRFVKHHCGELLRAILFLLAIQLPAMLIGFVVFAMTVESDAAGLGIAALGLGYLVLFAVSIIWFIFEIKGAIAASRGEWYRFPLVPRFGK